MIVVIHQAMKHLIVAGNSLIFMGKDGLKNYPLNRYVLERDGDGNVIEIVTKELISLVKISRNLSQNPSPTEVSAGGGLGQVQIPTDDDV